MRTSVFVFLVISNPREAINAFSIAQLVSAVVYALLYYGYFCWYIRKLNQARAKSKQKGDEKDKGGTNNTVFADMQDFPFESIWDLLPGFMRNNVTI